MALGVDAEGIRTILEHLDQTIADHSDDVAPTATPDVQAETDDSEVIRLAEVPESTAQGETGDSGPVIITEFLADPDFDAGSQSQWIELFNNSADPIDLSGWTFIVSPGGRETVSPDEALLIQPQQFVVLGTRLRYEYGAFKLEDVLPLDYEFEAIRLPRGAQLEIRDRDGRLIDKMRYFTDQVHFRKSTSLDPDAFDPILNDRPENWCESSSPMGSGEIGTPGHPNDTCPEGRFSHIETGQPPSLGLTCPESAMPEELYFVHGGAVAAAYAGYLITAIDVSIPAVGVLDAFGMKVDSTSWGGELPGREVQFSIEIRVASDAQDDAEIAVRVFAEMTGPRDRTTVAEEVCTTRVEVREEPEEPEPPDSKLLLYFRNALTVSAADSLSSGTVIAGPYNALRGLACSYRGFMQGVAIVTSALPLLSAEVVVTLDGNASASTRERFELEDRKRTFSYDVSRPFRGDQAIVSVSAVDSDGQSAEATLVLQCPTIVAPPTPVPAPEPVANWWSLVAKWGSVDSGDGQFLNPSDIALDASGNVYVVDTRNHRVQVFSPEGSFLQKWGSRGTGDGEFAEPSGLAVDASGNVYVVDTYNHRVQVFSREGGFLWKWGSEGTGDGQFQNPSDVALDASGNVYVVDEGNDRVQLFSAEGRFLLKWGSRGFGDGQFLSPRSIAVDPSGNVYVADTGGGRVKVFSPEGRFLRKWGSGGSRDGQFISPIGITVDASGNVYVVDSGNHRVQVFDPEGGFLRKWGSEGSGDGEFISPIGITVDASGNVYVVDTRNHRVQVFSVVLAD